MVSVMMAAAVVSDPVPAVVGMAYKSGNLFKILKVPIKFNTTG